MNNHGKPDSGLINRRQFVAAAPALFAAACTTTRTTVTERRPPPNIVVIIADDFGVGDIQALTPGNPIPTPNLDRLVHEGVVFTDAHSASAVCSPSRYGLLTGRYCWRTRLQEWVLDAYEPPLIAPDRLTLPQLLRTHGYHTACIGKWHLGWDWAGDGEGRAKKADFTVPIGSGPTTRGFDYYFGTDVPNFPPFAFIENDRVTVQPTGKNKPDPAIHIGFDNAPMAPGWRFDRILPALTERAVGYIHEQASSKRPFFLYFPMTSPHEPISPSEQFKGKSGIAPIADFLMETDWSAGQVINALSEAGVAENTLVIFAGDNGHSHYTGWELLVEHGHRPSGPYRGWKGEIWEGGHRVPFIVRWPGKVKAGSRCSQLISLNDVMATCAAIVGEKLPDNAAEDSVNMLPAFVGRARRPLREALVHHSVRGGFAIRQGPWKLVILSEKEGDPKFELYDFANDIAETEDVSSQHPDIVQRLTVLLESYVDEGRSTPGAPQRNDTLDIDFRHLPPQRWARPAPK
ncbi:MAG TPA: arylsulfatase [Candidatus Hydrogenedentes bacterium]|nr:arylsulfatase [Candidatus Hydrogenedentota bacterium]HQE83857.1 arylsulfatase [Candidatus Hydrogenedentota bacterium]HQH52013.1 arylsulfatase [Candidatus Hydrogenedentota bacterium]HQM47361.1 arylsulfatase [Candidatus Hydrogenedentota bacterium]